MCGAPKSKAPPPPPPPPAPPPVLEQTAPKSASTVTNTDRKRKGLSFYKIDGNKRPSASTKQLGGIPTRIGAGT